MNARISNTNKNQIVGRAERRGGGWGREEGKNPAKNTDKRKGQYAGLERIGYQ